MRILYKASLLAVSIGLLGIGSGARAIANLSRSITSKNQPAALQQANQVTLIAANMTKEFQPKVPVQVTLLDYYGREFEIWSTDRNVTQLRTTANKFRQTWNSLRPAVQTRNSAEARTFDRIVAQVETEKSPTEYGRLATPVLDAVDNLKYSQGAPGLECFSGRLSPR